MSQAFVQLSDLERTDILALWAFVSAQLNARWQGILERTSNSFSSLKAMRFAACFKSFCSR